VEESTEHPEPDGSTEPRESRGKLKLAVIIALITGVIGVVGVGVKAYIQASFEARTARADAAVEAQKTRAVGTNLSQRLANEKLLVDSLSSIFAAIGTYADGEIEQAKATFARCRKPARPTAEAPPDPLAPVQQAVDEFKARNTKIAESVKVMLAKQRDFDVALEAANFGAVGEVLANLGKESSALEQLISAQVQRLALLRGQSREINEFSQKKCPRA
jgi:hypothetical protein